MSSSSSDGPTYSLEGLAFLVTHWLANFDGGRGGPDDMDNACREERRQALEQVRHATAEIAAAFTTLGAFGTTFSVR